MSRLKSATLADQNITTELLILTKVLGAIVPEYPLRGRVRVSALAASVSRSLTLRAYADGELVCASTVLFTSGVTDALRTRHLAFSGVQAAAGATITITLASDNASDAAVGITARLDVDAVPSSDTIWVSKAGHDTDHDGRHPLSPLATLAAAAALQPPVMRLGVGIWFESLTVDWPCRIVGMGHGHTVINGAPLAGLVLESPVIVEDIWSQGSIGIEITSDWCQVRRCVPAATTLPGIALSGVAATTAVYQSLFNGDAINAALWQCRFINGAPGEGCIDLTGGQRVLDTLDAAMTSRASQTSVNALATILTGITSLAAWLRGLFRKSAMDATAKTEVNAGGGTFDEATDSNEALADKTAGLSPQETRDAMKLAPSAGDPAAGSVDAKIDAAKASADAAARPGNAMTLTSAYDAAKTAAQSSDIPTAAANAAKADEVLAAAHGAGSWEGVAESDWTAAERKQIRQALGVTGVKAAAVAGDLQAIKAKTDTIGAVEATYTSPAVTTSGPWEIHCGSAYREVDGRAITLVISGYGGPSLVGAEAALRLLARHRWAAEETVADLEVAATVSVDGTTVTLSADLEGEETAALEASPPRDTENYRAQFVVTPAGGEAFVIGDGELTALKGIGPIPEPVEE